MRKKLKWLFFCLIGLLFSWFFSCGGRMSDESHYSDNLLYKFGKSRKKYGLIAVGTGGSTNIDNKITSFFIAFETNRLITLEETRVLLVENIKALWETINAEKKHTSYYETFPFPIENIEVSIYGQASLEPGSEYIYIAHSLKGGMLYYYLPNPKGTNFGMVDFHKETFEDAKRIVDAQKAAAPPPPDKASILKRLREKCWRQKK